MELAEQPWTFTINGRTYTRFFVNNQQMFYIHTDNNEYIKNLSAKNLLKNEPSNNLLLWHSKLTEEVIQNSNYDKEDIVESKNIISEMSPYKFTKNNKTYTVFFTNNEEMVYEHEEQSIDIASSNQPDQTFNNLETFSNGMERLIHSTDNITGEGKEKTEPSRPIDTPSEMLLYEHKKRVKLSEKTIGHNRLNKSNKKNKELNNVGSSNHSNEMEPIIHSTDIITGGGKNKTEPSSIDTASKMPLYKRKKRVKHSEKKIVHKRLKKSNKKNKKLNDVGSTRDLQFSEVERTECNNAEEIIDTKETNITKNIGHDTKVVSSDIIAPTHITNNGMATNSVPRSSMVDDVTPENYGTNITSNGINFKCSIPDVIKHEHEDIVKNVTPEIRRGDASGYKVPAIQTFRPTWEEFKDFNAYIKAIEATGAHKAGVCKIIPPPEWVPRKAGYNVEKMNITIPRPLKQVAKGNNGLYTQYSTRKKKMNLQAFQELTNSEKYRTPPHKDFSDLEKLYWENITNIVPIYGADVSANLTDPECTAWNMNHLDTTLDYLKTDSDISIEGVNSVYLYFGMWKSTFAWHTEDMDLYSINYLHFGAPKTWYSIPTQHAPRFEEFAAKCFSEHKKICPGYLRHKTILISPSVLKINKIPFDVITQEAGEIMITFPLGYHAGFNHGFNCAESTNFATERWIDYGKHAVRCICRHAVNIDMDKFVKRFQPEQYDSWLQRENSLYPKTSFTGSGNTIADARNVNKNKTKKRYIRKRKWKSNGEGSTKVLECKGKLKKNNNDNESSCNLNYNSNYAFNGKDSEEICKKIKTS